MPETNIWKRPPKLQPPSKTRFSPAGHRPEFTEWRWEPMKNLPELVVPFKRPVYERVVEEFSKFAAK